MLFSRSFLENLAYVVICIACEVCVSCKKILGRSVALMMFSDHVSDNFRLICEHRQWKRGFRFLAVDCAS